MAAQSGPVRRLGLATVTVEGGTDRQVVHRIKLLPYEPLAYSGAIPTPMDSPKPKVTQIILFSSVKQKNQNQQQKPMNMRKKTCGEVWRMYKDGREIGN